MSYINAQRSICVSIRAPPYHAPVVLCSHHLIHLQWRPRHACLLFILTSVKYTFILILACKDGFIKSFPVTN